MASMQEDAGDRMAANAAMAERAGRLQEAAQIRATLLREHPNHPQALLVLARERLDRGDSAGAADYVARAERADGGRNPDIPLFAGMLHNLQGRLEDAVGAFDRALAIDPYFLLAMLSKAAALERLGQIKTAAIAYRNALKMAPTSERLPPALRQQLDHAKTVVEANAAALAEHLRARTAEQRKQYSSKGEDLTRFDESLEIFAGVKPRQQQDPVLFYFPRLPAIPFFDRAYFPWLARLEEATEDIRSELEVVMREDWKKFSPYIQFPPGAPVNQWAKLNHSPAWTTYFLWRDGKKVEENCARCPRTTELLESLPLAWQQGYAPTVVFSLLEPHTHIPPHTGSSNARLIGHLPLILPDNCRFRVGNETRDWRMGEAWVFDDTIDHEAWNNSDEIRVLLIFDTWNPLLTEAERELITAMLAAFTAF